MENLPALELTGISKRFHHTVANTAVDFSLKQGEIHALLGENGAGKSTLMNIICGLVQPDEGEIRIQGQLQKTIHPDRAIQLGIGMVHQHFMIVPGFTTLENIILGSEPVKGPAIDFKKARNQIAAVAANFGVPIDPEAITADLPVGLQQQVEIFKALYRNARILILDEPTAVLTPQEIKDLFRIMRHLAAAGVSIVFITHKLREVMAVADTISVMQHGTIKETCSPAETDEAALARIMIGREITLKHDHQPASAGETVFETRGLSVRDTGGVRKVSGASFCVRRGEIVGIAGIQGNGQTELAEAIAGLRKIESGEILLNGSVMPPLHPRKMIEAGFSHIPEDRSKFGLVLPFSVAENQVLCTYYQNPFARFMVRRKKTVIRYAEELIQQFAIRTRGPDETVRTLSGGNQQKVIISREVSRKSVFLLACQPTRGLDVGSIEYVHGQLMKLRRNGMGILLVSSELEEVLALADVILVMYRGCVIPVERKDVVTAESLGLIMARGLEAER